jgi:hypothetical protein
MTDREDDDTTEEEEDANDVQGPPRTGFLIVCTMLCLTLAIEGCLCIGMPMGTGSLTLQLYYWALLALFVTMTPALVLFLLAVIVSNNGWMICALVTMIASLVVRALSFAYMVIIWKFCDGDAHCADNLNCLGGVIPGEPFEGPSVPFAMLTCVVAVDIVVNFAAVFVGFMYVFHWGRSRVVWKKQKNNPGTNEKKFR